METLTREPETATAVAEPAPETPVAARPCPTCGAEMAAGQDWCLECGTARPDRAATAPNWAGATAVLIATGVLALGAVAAAWAGLSADAKRVAAPNQQASLPAQPPAQPPAQTQAAPPPANNATPPAAAKPSKPAKPKATKSAAPPAAATPPASSTPSTPAPAASTPSKKTTTTSEPKQSNSAKLVAVDLAADAARTYNPYARPEDDFTDAKLAIDGKKDTSWTAKAASNGVGVDLDLGKLTGVRALQLATTTPGMTVEVYATKDSSEPVSIQDPGWDHLATQLDVGTNERIRLGEGTDRYRHVLIWPTEPPPDGDHFALSELELFK